MHRKRYTTDIQRLPVPLKALLALALIISLNFRGCETEDWLLETDCGECFDSRPDSADLIVRLTIGELNDSVPIVVYRGSFEEGEVDWIDTATTENYYLYSKTDQEYTVRATYLSETGDTIVAFDSDKMVVRDAADECGYPCFMVKGGIFDLKLLQ